MFEKEIPNLEEATAAVKPALDLFDRVYQISDDEAMAYPFKKDFAGFSINELQAKILEREKEQIRLSREFLYTVEKLTEKFTAVADYQGTIDLKKLGFAPDTIQAAAKRDRQATNDFYKELYLRNRMYEQLLTDAHLMSVTEINDLKKEHDGDLIEMEKALQPAQSDDSFESKIGDVVQAHIDVAISALALARYAAQTLEMTILAALKDPNVSMDYFDHAKIDRILEGLEDDDSQPSLLTYARAYEDSNLVKTSLLLADANLDSAKTYTSALKPRLN